MSSQPQPAKRKWKRIVAVLACLLLAWLVFGLPDAIRNLNNQSEWMTATKALQSLPPGLKESIGEFKSAKRADGNPLPTEVPIQALVSTGRLKPADVVELAGYSTFVSLQADETAPNSVLVRIQTPSGRQVVLNSDGSVMMLPQKP